MLSTIIAAENHIDTLLPVKRLEGGLPEGLLDAARKWSEAVWVMAQQMGSVPLTPQQIEQGLKLAQNPVFICGVHRSGTTLLKDMLDGHPDMVVLPSEGTYYTNQEAKLQQLPPNEWAAFLGKEWLRRIANPINQAPYWLLGRSNEEGSPYVDFARYIMAWWQVVQHKPGTQWPHTAIILAYAACTNQLAAKLWVDKTPTNERFINRIWHEMPNAKIIHLVREPMATLTSRKKMEPSVSLKSAVRYLKSSFSIAATQANRGNPQYLLLRYEDICNDAETATKRLAQFLDIAVLPVLNGPSVAGRPAQANSSFNKETEAGIILKPNQHIHQEILSTAEKQLIAAYVGKLAAKQNYTLAPVGFLRSLYFRVAYRLLK